MRNQYWNKNWTKKENEEIFGDDVKIHGHNYDLFVTISGPIDNESGFIINIKLLNHIVNKHVIDIFDHQQIEKDIDWFKNHQPSTENMVTYIWNILNQRIPSPAKLHKIKLQETPTIYTEYSCTEYEK